jgi:hypothetical protein
MSHRRKDELVNKMLRWVFEEPEMCVERLHCQMICKNLKCLRERKKRKLVKSS